MNQDFSRKFTIVLQEDLASWQLTNTIGHIAAWLGNKCKEPFDTGESFVTSDGLALPRNSQFAVVALKASTAQLWDLLNVVPQTSLQWMAYTQDMIDHIDDVELCDALSKQEGKDLAVLGIGLFGTKEELKTQTGHLKLWK